MNSKGLIWIVVGVLLLCLCVSGVSAVCQPYSVCNVTTGIDCGIVSDSNFNIQNCINGATPGDTIRIDGPSGISKVLYHTITVPKPLTILAGNPFNEGVPIIATGAGIAITIENGVDGVILDGFTLDAQTAGGIGVYIPSKNNIVRNISFVNHGGYGGYDTDISINSDNNTIQQCNLDGGLYGIDITGNNNTVKDSQISNINVTAIFIGASGDFNYKNNTIVNNTFMNIVPNDKATTPMTIGIFSPNNTISSNNFTNARSAIVTYGPIEQGQGNGINNLIYNNIFDHSSVNALLLDDGGHALPPADVWNIAKTPGLNIIHGNYLGGNYWGTDFYSGSYGWSQTCTDGGDGICTAPYSANGYGVYDAYPLTSNAAPTLAPTITSVSPAFGSTAGSSTVVITGTNFLTVTGINFDGIIPLNFVINNDQTITTATIPSHAAGVVDVAVTNPGGTAIKKNAYTYQDPRPVAAFGGPTTGTISSPVTFTDLSYPTATGWAWYFGDENYAGSWVQQNASAGWAARYGHSSVTLPDGSIVVLGGLHNDVWRSTDQGLSWTRMNASAGWSSRWKQSAVVMLDGSIVVMGGASSPNYYNDTWRSTDKGATWTQMNASSGWIRRGGQTAVALSDGSIVLMGGESGVTYLNDTWRSEDYGLTWTQMNASSGWTVRTDHTSVAMPDDSIVLMGGFPDPVHQNKNDVWHSTDKGKTWTQLKPNDANGWSARMAFSSVAMPDGSILVIGGWNGGSALNDVWRSTNNGATWGQVSASSGLPARSWASSVVIPDGSIVLMGGTSCANPGSCMYNDVYRFTTASQIPSHPYSTPGTYQVALQAYNINGYSSIRKSNYITVSGGGTPAPVADFTFDATKGTTVQFNDMSTNTPTSWAWAYKNATVDWTQFSTTKNPSFTFAPGTYDINLTATNAYGSSSKTKPVTVLPTPPAGQFNLVSTDPVACGGQVKLSGGQTPINLQCTGDVLIGATTIKNLNGDGPIKYYYVDDNGVHYLADANSLPTNIVMQAESPLSETNSVNSGQSVNPGGPGLGNLALVPKCSAGDCTHNYAVLIDGGKNATMNHIRYWNDISFMYQTLREYGYPKANIIVLMSDGTDTANADRHYDTQNSVALTDSSPLDLDSDNSNEVTDNALKTTVTSTLTNLGTGKGTADSLFIFTTGHGGPDYTYSGTNNSILYLWNDEYINDTEFVNALPTQFGNITMVMEQCYSGGFIDNFATNYAGDKKRIIATAANGSEPSYGNGFSNVWTRGVAMITDDRKSSTEADSSPYDQKISMAEAFNFANATDPAASSTLANHEHPQYATKNADGATKFMVNGACTSPDSINLIAPNGGETWNVGTKRNITWTSTGTVSGHTVKIELYNSATSVTSSIINPTAASTGLYTWTIPNSAGTSWKVKITDLTTSTNTDMSDANFKIVASSTKGSLNITAVNATNNAKLAGASIYLDGILQAGKVTNANGYYLFTASTIDPGSHTVTVKLTGYLDQSQGFVLDPGTQGKVVSFRLEPTSSNSPDAIYDAGKIVITSTPSNAEVFIDGGDTGLTTPAEKMIIPGTDWANYPKKYTVTVTAPYGYKQALPQTVSVGRGWTANANLQFEPDYTVPPVIVNIVVPNAPDNADDNKAATISAKVTDPHVGDTLTGSMNWDDGITTSFTFSVDPLGDGQNYIGSTSHSYTNPGIYRVTLTVTDSYHNTATKEAENYIATYDPDAGYVIGAGSIVSPPGAYALDTSRTMTGKAYFGFVSKYVNIKGKFVPEGVTEFYFETPNMNFLSINNTWLIVNGANATYKGTGKIRGMTGSYTFVVSTVDGALKTTDKFDRFRIKITDNKGATVYDNNLIDQSDEAIPETKIQTGFIIINKK